MQQIGVGRSVLVGTAVVVVASLFGLFGLPVVFGRLFDSLSALVWLALALACCLCLLISARPLAGVVAGQLRRVSGSGHDWTDRASRELASLVVAVVCVVLVQAILRRPLVAVFGAGAEAFLVEAVVGIVALLALLLLLSWAYAIARPLVEGLARSALDTAFATSAPPLATSAPSLAPVAREPPRPAVSPAVTTDVSDAPTLVTPGPRIDAAATDVAPVADTPTIVAPLPYLDPGLTEQVDPDATQVKR